MDDFKTERTHRGFEYVKRLLPEVRHEKKESIHYTAILSGTPLLRQT